MNTFPNLSARISPQALRMNLRALRARIPWESALSVLVKSDAYGHGMATVARVAMEEGARFLLVASLDEAMQLRDYGISGDILLIGPLFPEEAAAAVEQDFVISLGSLETAQALDKAAHCLGRKARVHLKLDTGMGRWGFLDSGARLSEVLEQLLALSGLTVEGIMTHFSESDIPESDYTQEQAARFRNAVAELHRRDLHPEWVHAANSGAVLYFPEAGFSMTRLGLAAYGAYPGPNTAESGPFLEPVMSLVCRVADIRQVPANTPISYSRTYYTKRPSRLALLPVGYGHGYPRHASGKAEVMIRGTRAPVLGRITMNLCVADVTDIPDVATGDPVLLFGRLGNDILRVEELAQAANTIPYEILCNVGRCAPRVVVEA